MRTFTYAEIKAKVEGDLDMEGEDFVTDTELMGYVNDGIDEAEATIHNLNEDYFLSQDVVSIVAATQDYALPTDIYASKIRLVQWNDGVTKYQVSRIPLAEIAFVESTDEYRYQIVNLSAVGPSFRLHPTPGATDSTSMTRYYIRNATRMTAEDSICDIPEFSSFVINFAKVQCAIKEMHPRLEFFQGELEKSRGLMIATLNEMVPDGDNTIPMDMSSYDELN